MKDKSARVASVLFCVGSCLGGLHSALAADLGFYVGGYLGMSSREVPRAPFDEFKNGLHAFAFFTATEDRTSFDDSDFAFGITGGYRLNQYLAFEGGYVNLGEVILESHATGTFPVDNGSMNIERRERDQRLHRVGARHAAAVARLGAVRPRRRAVREQQDQVLARCARRGFRPAGGQPLLGFRCEVLDRAVRGPRDQPADPRNLRCCGWNISACSMPASMRPAGKATSTPCSSA